MSTVAQTKLLELSRQLPAEKVHLVLDFVEFLLARTPAQKTHSAGKGGRKLRRYIGGVKHGELASGIDDELYGRSVR